MQIGSIVKPTRNFDDERRIYGLNYPVKTDTLTINRMELHPEPNCRQKGLILLYFDETPALPGICHKTIYGKANFVELLPPIDLEKELKKEIKPKVPDFLSSVGINFKSTEIQNSINEIFNLVNK